MITKELVAQWAKESRVTFNKSKTPSAYLTREQLIQMLSVAEAYGAEQRERELLAVGMDMCGYLYRYKLDVKAAKGEFDRDPVWLWKYQHGDKLFGDLPEETEEVALYTAKQLAAARLQSEPFAYYNEGIEYHTRGKVIFHKKPTQNLEVRWWTEDKPLYTSPQPTGATEMTRALVNQGLIEALEYIDSENASEDVFRRARAAITAAEQVGM